MKHKTFRVDRTAAERNHVAGATRRRRDSLFFHRKVRSLGTACPGLSDILAVNRNQ